MPEHSIVDPAAGYLESHIPDTLWNDIRRLVEGNSRLLRVENPAAAVNSWSS